MSRNHMPFQHLCIEFHPIKSYQIKSLQWPQKVGCLKNLWTILWSLTTATFFCLKAPLLCTPFAIGSAIFAGWQLSNANAVDIDFIYAHYRAGFETESIPYVYVILRRHSAFIHIGRVRYRLRLHHCPGKGVGAGGSAPVNKAAS